MARKGFKPANGFDKDPDRARAAGAKSNKSLPPELKEARLMNAQQVEACLYKYMQMPKDELNLRLKDPSTPAMELVIIRILVVAIEKGDPARLDFLLSRTIGKIADKVDIRAAVVTTSLHDMIMKEIENGDK